jgi:hypothetical protein
MILLPMAAGPAAGATTSPGSNNSHWGSDDGSLAVVQSDMQALLDIYSVSTFISQYVTLFNTSSAARRRQRLQ